MHLSETQNNKVNFLLHPHPYRQLYNRLKDIVLKNNNYYLFFAQPDVMDDTTNWATEFKEIDTAFGNRGVKSFDSLTDDEKNDIADYIEDMVGEKDKDTGKIKRKGKIAQILSKDNTFQNLWEEIFLVPAASDIKVVKTEEGIIPILTQWGCKSNETTSHIDPLSVIINRPRPNRAKVIIQVFYTDGSKATDKLFYIEYLGASIKCKTNKNGLFNYAPLRFGVQFKVYYIINQEEAYLHEFTVKEEETNKEGEFIAVVTFPLFTTGTVKVVNQKEAPLPDREIIIEVENKESYIKQTNKTGKIDLEGLEVGKQITIKEKDNPENTETYTIERDNNIFKLVIVCPIPTTATITVIDAKTDEIQFGYPVMVEYDEKKKEYLTAEDGIIRLDNLIAGNEFKITDVKHLNNFQLHTLGEENNDYVLKVDIPKPKLFKIKVIEHKYHIPYIWGPKRNLENVVVDFINSKGETITRTTDKDGFCAALPQDDFDTDKKVKALVHLVKKNRKGEKKEKIVKKTFTFKTEN